MIPWALANSDALAAGSHDPEAYAEAYAEECAKYAANKPRCDFEDVDFREIPRETKLIPND